MTTPISLVGVGTAANDGTGDTIRSAFQTQNNNWTYMTSYTITTATNNIVLNATSGARKFVANGVGTLSNVWINVPATAGDGQELQITSLVPITSCWVRQSGQSIMWLGNGFFSGGNVTARLTYTTTNNRWMTF